MRVLVTGGCGFIGSHVVDALIARGDQVVALDDLSSGKRHQLHPHARHVEGDVADAACVATLISEADAVIHLAAIASVAMCESEPERAYRTNVTGTQTIFHAASTRVIPVVYASSAAVYGDNPNLPLTETMAPSPLSSYGRHKHENEQIADRYAGAIPSTGLRFFNVYGPRQDAGSPYSGVISLFLEAARTGNTLTFFGDGGQTRDFLYVTDVVDLVLKALGASEGAKILNGCTGRATRLTQLAETIGKVLGSPITTRHLPPRKGDIRHSLGSPVNAAQRVQFHARVDLEEGLRRFLLGSA